MTTETFPAAAAPAEPAARLRDLLAAEWIKLHSLRSTHWVLGVGALLVIGINVNSARSNASRLEHQPAVDPVNPDFRFDPLITAFVDPAWQILVILAGSVGALAVFGEYTTGLIRTTFTAVPDRRALLTAKAAVVAAVVFVFGTVVAGASFGLTQAILREHGGLSLGDPGALRAVAASALLAPLCALAGMALGALIRHATGTIVAVVGVLLLLPALFQGDTYRWVAEIGNMMPLSAWEVLVRNPESTFDPGKYPMTITEAWIVFAAWPLAAALVTLTAVHHTDL
ncbi:ABC transporter permease subunit [Streptomyces sp. N2-109]|uniref:ABC transporter permease subunit n=1 Tax=Streptomyces gossypii TaxID=2883101 RepID=A0ABT2JLA9_9ACTN|nr:ABC transporter permease subunit [Streptomyces gossypii]MCT2588662.1 ABC transporter permease subunit [Streptomyces gossypii]